VHSSDRRLPGGERAPSTASSPERGEIDKAQGRRTRSGRGPVVRTGAERDHSERPGGAPYVSAGRRASRATAQAAPCGKVDARSATTAAGRPPLVRRRRSLTGSVAWTWACGRHAARIANGSNSSNSKEKATGKEAGDPKRSPVWLGGRHRLGGAEDTPKRSTFFCVRYHAVVYIMLTIIPQCAMLTL
jgi:hypothetical protein